MKRIALPFLAVACLPLLTACPGDDTTDDEVGDTGTETATDTGTDDPTTESTSTDTTTTDDTTESTTDDTTESTTESTTDTTDTTDTSTDTSTDTTETGMPGEAMIRVLHLGLDAPNVDVWVDGAVAVMDLAFQSGTDYLVVPEGPHSVAITATGMPLDTAVLTADLDLAADTKYSAVAYDYLMSLSALALVDDDQGIDPANTRLQISHTAPDVGQVDVWALLDPPVMLVENVDFGATASVDVPAGAVDVGVDVNDDMVPDLIYSVPDLGGGTFVDVYAANEAGGSPVFLLAHLPDGSTARLDANCGNDVVDAFETCDGADLGGETCVGLGYLGGTLSCTASCDAFVEDNCVNSWWGEDFEGGAVLPPEWVLGGNMPNWLGTNVMPQAGMFSGTNGNINDNQSNYMEVTLNFANPGTVQFWYRVSTEQGWDFLRFSVDGVQQTQWSGTIAWTQSVVYNIAAGNHTLRWTYFKDGSVSSGSDSVWVDNIVTTNGLLP